MKKLLLREVDKVKITILFDNGSDHFLPDKYIVKRVKMLPPNAPMSEPELSYGKKE